MSKLSQTNLSILLASPELQKVDSKVGLNNDAGGDGTTTSRKKKGGMRRQKSKSTGELTRNRISFGNSKTLVFEKQIADDDEEHKNAVWFSDREMKGIKKELRQSIKKGEITRGLEQYEGGSSSRGKRESHARAILHLQQQQRQSGVVNEESFSLLSRAMSSEDLKKAQALASKDSAHALQEHLKTPATCITRTSSAKALDNFRKGMVLSTGALDKFNGMMNNFGNGEPGALAGRPGGGKNATFSPIRTTARTRRSKKAPNMLLQAMANKEKNSSSNNLKDLNQPPLMPGQLSPKRQLSPMRAPMSPMRRQLSPTRPGAAGMAGVA